MTVPEWEGLPEITVVGAPMEIAEARADLIAMWECFRNSEKVATVGSDGVVSAIFEMLPVEEK